MFVKVLLIKKLLESYLPSRFYSVLRVDQISQDNNCKTEKWFTFRWQGGQVNGMFLFSLNVNTCKNISIKIYISKLKSFFIGFCCLRTQNEIFKYSLYWDRYLSDAFRQ